jgi:hypothetical protein
MIVWTYHRHMRGMFTIARAEINVSLVHTDWDQIDKTMERTSNGMDWHCTVL